MAALQFFRKCDPEFPQLLRINFGRRLRHQFLAAVIFWECHHIADGLLAADHHDQAVESERNPPMWRRTEAKGAQQMAELRLLLFRAHAESFEHFRLQLRLMNADAAAADFDAV